MLCLVLFGGKEEVKGGDVESLAWRRQLTGTHGSGKCMKFLNYLMIYIMHEFQSVQLNLA